MLFREEEKKHVEVKRVGTQALGIVPRGWFTGTVRIDLVFQAADPKPVQGVIMTFEPGARSHGIRTPLGRR